MTRNLGIFVVVLSLATAASAMEGSISGSVKDAAGTPQMGAVVQVFTAASAIAQTAYTDSKGKFNVRDLGPGSYSVKVTAANFLPSIRENITLRSGAHVLVNLTLNTLFEAMQMLPPRRDVGATEDDWKWTLRSMSNRPILRVLDEEGPLVVVQNSEKADDRALKARVAFIAGSDSEGYGGSDVATQFNLEQSLFRAGSLTLDGNVAYGSGIPNGALRATYSHKLPNGAEPEVAFTFRRFAPTDLRGQNPALSALALSLSDSTTIADFVEVNYGGELQSVQYANRVTVFRPYGSASVSVTPNTMVEYRYSTVLPTTRLAKGFDTAPADLTETNPRLSLTNGRIGVENAKHHEISVSQRIGANRFQVAAYRDRVSDVALNGTGSITPESADFLGDVFSGTFAFNGGDFETSGLRLVAERRINDLLTATFDYGFGGVLTGAPGLSYQQARQSIRAEQRHSLAGKLNGRVNASKTRWIASYRWTSGDNVLTPVDMFNASAGQADPYLSIFLRQPLPRTSFIPGRMEALVDVRNLLAQGYMPMVGQDGSTLYLVQAPRSIRGGLAFTF